MPDDYDCSSQLSQLGRYLSIARYFLSVYGPNKSVFLEKQIGVFFVTDEPLDVSDPVGSVLISIKSMEGLPARSEIDAYFCRATAVDLSSGHQFEEEIGDASSENGLFMARMEFSVRTPGHAGRSDCLRKFLL